MRILGRTGKPLTRELKISLISYAFLDAVWMGLLLDRWLHPQKLHGHTIGHMVWQGAFFCLIMPLVNLSSLYRRTFYPPNETIHVTPVGPSASLR